MKNQIQFQPLLRKFGELVLFFLIMYFLFHPIQNVLAQTTTIQMNKEGGVYTVPCKVNGLPLKFIFDTGASDVTISLTEAEFMFKNGLLKETDIIGKESFQTATGVISEGVKIILREIIFGEVKLTNVVASIVLNTQAPLLLGQSVLTRIGKYQIDPINNLIIITANSNNSNKTSVTDFDNNIYPITKIGNQIWMTENLKVQHYNNGDPIQEINNDQDWTNSQTGAFCYYKNDTTNKRIFGNLYNWQAIIDSRGICPNGWHVPSESEFMNLISFLKNQNKESGSLKSTKFWKLPNEKAENFSGFSLLPGGKRWYNNAKYEFMNSGGYFWTSSSYDFQSAYFFTFSFDSPVSKLGHFIRYDGFSCRCLKD